MLDLFHRSDKQLNLESVDAVHIELGFTSANIRICPVDIRQT